MKQLIKKLAIKLGIFKPYRPVEPAHIFVGVKTEEGIVGIIVESGDEEIEIKLEPYRAAMLADNIHQALTHL